MIYGVYVEKGREGCKLNLNYKSFLHIHTCACIYIKYFILKIQFFTPKTSLYLFFISFNKLDKCSSFSPFRALHIFINTRIGSKGTLKTCLLKSLIFFFFYFRKLTEVFWKYSKLPSETNALAASTFNVSMLCCWMVWINLNKSMNTTEM